MIALGGRLAVAFGLGWDASRSLWRGFVTLLLLWLLAEVIFAVEAKRTAEQRRRRRDRDEARLVVPAEWLEDRAGEDAVGP